MTFLFGRIYCSTLCPLATVQDLFAGRKKKYSFRKLSFKKRYLIPLISLIVLFSGFPALASAVDPYSMTGRMVSSINELIILPFIDLTGLIFRKFSVYITTYPIQFRWLTISVSIISAALILFLSRIGGRLYCNTFCPVGALLSIPARWALFTQRINQEKCTSCGACERVCKAEAIDSLSKIIDSSKCISCFNCSGVCNFDALKFGSKGKISKEVTPLKVNQSDRRDFLKKSTFGSIALLGLPILTRADSLSLDIRTSFAAVPPGSGGTAAFLSRCTSCSLCISRCPGNVLQPAGFNQYGLKGIGVPYLDFNKGSCDFECKLCSDLCPSGAIKPLDLEVKKRLKIGEAKFVREFCVVETDGTSCGACAEICPTGAIDMVSIGISDEGVLEIPVLNSEYCIGCGACQFVCPVLKKNAIFVEALKQHSRSEIREDKADDEPEKINNDFAF
jgi:ferredoxin